jgi:DNA-directed RNA polymerase subunit RPC12/RpoP
MATSTYFVQECPTCGRRLHIRVEYLGKRVVCPHCRGALIAGESSPPHPSGLEAAQSLLRRADEILQHAAQRTGQGPRG